MLGLCVSEDVDASARIRRPRGEGVKNLERPSMRLLVFLLYGGSLGEEPREAGVDASGMPRLKRPCMSALYEKVLDAGEVQAKPLGPRPKSSLSQSSRVRAAPPSGLQKIIHTVNTMQKYMPS